MAKSLHNAVRDGRVSTADLIDYARRPGNASLQARLGYLLEALDQPTDGLTPPTDPVRLGPRRPRRGDYNPRWHLYLNVPPGALFPEGVG